MNRNISSAGMDIKKAMKPVNRRRIFHNTLYIDSGHVSTEEWPSVKGNKIYEMIL